jgi:hypothetical protein
MSSFMGAGVVNRGYYDIPINNQYSNKELPRNKEQKINESNFNKIINNRMNNSKQNYILEPSNMGVYQDPSSLSFDSKIPLLKKKEQICNYVNNQNNQNYVNNQNVESFSNITRSLSVNHNNYADRDYLNSQFIPNVSRNYWQDNDPSYSSFQSISEPNNVFNNLLPNTCNTCEPSASKYNMPDLSYNRGIEGYNQNNNPQNSNPYNSNLQNSNLQNINPYNNNLQNSNLQNNNPYNDFKLPIHSNPNSQINSQFNLPISRNIYNKPNSPIFINQKDIKRDLKKYIKVESKVRGNIEPLTKIAEPLTKVGEPLLKVGGNKSNNKKRIKNKRRLKKNNKKNKDFSKDTLWNIIYGLTFIILLFIIKFLYDSKIFNKIN